MFETAQQESSSGTVKIVGGAVAVGLILLGAVYFLYLRHEPAATPQSAAGAAVAPAAGDEEANPTRDLVILRSSLGRDQTQTMAMWNIQVSNRSRTYAYRNIQYETSYYDGQNNLVRNGAGTLGGQLEPGDQQTISQNDGLYPVGTTTYTIEIKGAEGFRQ